jgi:phytoene/squalene synthetase
MRRTPTTSSNLASAITKAASKQTFYTIRFLVDRPRIDDAFLAYAYFRWVDDVLDAGVSPNPTLGETERLERRRFLDRQRSLLDECLQGHPPRDVNARESMLVDLVRHADREDGALETYLRQMMLVMDFDVRRRGRLVSEVELSEYTRWLAVAVTEAMHHFIGGGDAPPHDASRYRAVAGAHILHMLRDTAVDLRAGYFNVPREWLERFSIGPGDLHCDAYRAWVAGRVELARGNLEAGRAYYGRVRSLRHRLAGLAYLARFEWLIQQLERDEFRLRSRYDDLPSLSTSLRMSWLTLAGLAGLRRSSGRRTAGPPPLHYEGQP